jgi:acyl carrier protein
MKQPSTSAQLREYISATFFVDQFDDDDSFLGAGIIDSTGMLELIDFVEQRFEIDIDESELVPANLDSVSNLVAFIERKRAPALAG